MSLCLCGQLQAQTPALTTVKDTVYRSDGTPASGTVVITWPAFVTGDSKAVFGGTKTLPLTNGALAVALAPNSGATPSGTSYQVKYFQSGGVFFEETWVVPTSSPLANPAQPVSVTQVGTPGSTTYHYWCTATNANGETLLSPSRITTTSNATLSGTNYNVITCATVTGATGYKAYRTTSATTPSGTGNYLVGSSATTTINDQSNTLQSATIPALNTTDPRTLSAVRVTAAPSSTVTLAASQVQGNAIVSSPSATQTITAPAGSGIPLQIKGRSNNTSNLFELYDNQTTPVLRSWFDASGAFQTSQAPTFSSITSGSLLFGGTGGLLSQDNTNLFWDNTAKRLQAGPRTGFNATLQGYVDGVTNNFGLRDASAIYYAPLQGTYQDNGTGQIFGVLGAVESANPTGTRGNAIGIGGDAYHTAAGGAVSELMSVQTFAQCSAGTCSNMYGVRVLSHVGGGAITNNVGIQVDNQAGVGTNNWAIKTGTGKVQFGDALYAKATNEVRQADQFAGATAGAKIAAAITDLPATGGTVDARGLEGAQTISATIIVNKNIKLLLGSATFTSSVVPIFDITSPSVLSGGGSWTTVLATTATSGDAIRVDLSGVTEKQNSVILDAFLLDGPGSGTGDGIKVLSGLGWKIRDVVVQDFGNDGVAVNSGTPGDNANLGILDNVSSYRNGRYGFFLTGVDTNLITFLATDSRSNAEGYHIESAWNVFVGAYATSNTTYAFNITGTRGFDNSGTIYIEGGQAGSVLIFGAATTRNRIEILNNVSGNPTITDNGSANSYLRFDGTRYGWVNLPSISLRSGGGGPITLNETVVPLTSQSTNVGSTTTQFLNLFGVQFSARRRGTGSGNGEIWGYNFHNAAGDDLLSLSNSSSTYTTGGGLGWVGNNTPFIYFNSSQSFKIGSGTGTAPAITINGTTHNMTLGGNGTKTLGMDRHLTANTAGNSLTIQAGGATSGATDKTGGAMIVQPGLGTGNSVPALARVQQDALGGVSGTADHTRVDRLITGATKVLTNNTNTALVNATIASNTSVGGLVSYCVEVVDANNDQQVECGKVTYTAMNKGGTVSGNMATLFGTVQPTPTAGTLTVTWTITAANPAVLTINANSSLTPSSGYPRVTYSIENLTQQAVAVQ